MHTRTGSIPAVERIADAEWAGSTTLTLVPLRLLERPFYQLFDSIGERDVVLRPSLILSRISIRSGAKSSCTEMPDLQPDVQVLGVAPVVFEPEAVIWSV